MPRELTRHPRSPRSPDLHPADRTQDRDRCGEQQREEEQRDGRTLADVAAAVRFLVSPDASYITGSTIDVNGGYRMQ